MLADMALALAMAQISSPGLDVPQAERFAALALDCVHQQYPNKIAHTLTSDADVRPPRELTPIFYGCFDWHSSVHGHWLLARVARLHPDSDVARRALAALDSSFTAPRAASELAYLRAPGRQEFERPYGLAWLLQLTAELREWRSSESERWLAVLEPLEAEAVARLTDWLPKLTHPIRTGEHSQTAFAFGLALDWARVAGDTAFEQLLLNRSRAFYLNDRGCPLAYEPSGQDFLSPCLAEADLMRRVLARDDFTRWLHAFLPDLPRVADASWLAPGVVTDPTDGKLAHLDGLNISRAWMLEGILAALPEADERRPALAAAAERHRTLGLAAVTGEHYAGGHWLGSFALYLTSRRGL